MKTDAFPPINKVPPKAGETPRVVARLPNIQVSQEAAIARVKPSLQEEGKADEKVLEVSGNIASLGEKSVDVAQGLDPERVKKLLEED